MAVLRSSMIVFNKKLLYLSIYTKVHVKLSVNILQQQGLAAVSTQEPLKEAFLRN
jgi:hypothetical protein